MSKDWISKCRTCMSTVNGGYQIYDYVESGSRILEMLDTLVPQIRIKDEIMDLSTAICSNCVERITDGYKFLNLCIHTNNNLRLQLVNAQSLEEPPLTIKNETEENVELMIKCENNSEDDCIEDSEEFIETPSNIEKDCLDNRYDYMDIK